MTTELGPLYHWSPRAVRKRIDRLGLMPSQKSASAVVLNEDDGFRQPMICFSPDPATAWAYSHAVFGTHGVFDLWQVWLEPTDQVHVLPMWGGRIVEVRVANRIMKRRLRWVGERTVTPGR